MVVEYNLIAEYVAFAFALLALINISLDNQLPTARFRAFKALFLGTFLSIVVTITTTIASSYFLVVPIWINEFLKVCYYILVPIAPAICYFYAVTLMQPKSFNKDLDRKWFLMLIPYLFYDVLIISNYFTHQVFWFDAQIGYVGGPLRNMAFVIAIFYSVLVLVVSIRNYMKYRRGIDIVLCINIILSTLISIIQLYVRETILSGVASTIGLFVIYLYMQNSNKNQDDLTGLYNRSTLSARLNKLIQNDTKFSLYLCSVRNFKNINECYGLEAGDAILEKLAQRLLQLNKKKMVFRYSGDEFVVVYAGRGQTEKISLIKQKFQEPFYIEGQEIIIDAIFTCVEYPDYGSDRKTLLSAADYSIALIKNGSVETDYIHSLSVRDEMQRYHMVIDQLKKAIDQSGFVLNYQPVYSMEGKSFVQAEALLRLRNGDNLQLYPSEFIPIAEKTGLIIRMTYLVVEKVCQDLVEMKTQLPSHLVPSSISVNFPYTMFMQDEVTKTLLKILQKYQVSTKEIKIEITERTLASDIRVVQSVICEMQEAGFEFELDDFGIDYSNMSVFLSLPVDIVKIDRSLIVAMIDSDSNRLFIRQMIQAILSTNRQVIVEGVETQEVVEQLVAWGCQMFQGYVYSKPLPIETYVDFVKAKEGIGN